MANLPSPAFLSVSLSMPLAPASGGTGAATATAGQIFAGPASGNAAAPTFRVPTLSDVANWLGYTPARPVTIAQATQADPGGFPTGSNNAGIYAPVTFTATATTLLGLSQCYLLANAGEQTGFYLELYDNTAGSLTATGQPVVITASASFYAPVSALLLATALALGHSYTLRLRAYQNDNTATVHAYGLNVNAVNL